MTEANIAQTIRQAIQDFVAPELRELKANHASLEKLMDVRFVALDKRMDDDRSSRDVQVKAFEGRMNDRFHAMETRMDDRFHALEKSMSEDRAVRDAQFKAMMATFDAATTRQVSDMDRRVTRLETLYGQLRPDSASPQLT